MGRGRWWRGLVLVLLMAAAALAAVPAARGPVPAADPPPAEGPPATAPAAPPASPALPPADEDPEEPATPLAPPPLPDGPDGGELLEAVLPLWDIYQQAVAADEQLLDLARRLEAGDLSFWRFALAARRIASEQQENLRRFSALAQGVPEDARSFAGPARESLEHRLQAARLAERAALTLSEKGYADAVEQHRLAVAKGVSATVNLITLFHRYELSWPPR